MPGPGPHGAQLGNQHRVLARHHMQCPGPAQAHAALARLETLRGTAKCVRGIASENGGLGAGKLRLLGRGKGGHQSAGNRASLVLLLTRQLVSSCQNSLGAARAQRKKKFFNNTVPRYSRASKPRGQEHSKGTL